jgi:hypothetical protein
VNTSACTAMKATNAGPDRLPHENIPAGTGQGIQDGRAPRCPLSGRVRHGAALRRGAGPATTVGEPVPDAASVPPPDLAGVGLFPRRQARCWHGYRRRASPWATMDGMTARSAPQRPLPSRRSATPLLRRRRGPRSQVAANGPSTRRAARRRPMPRLVALPPARPVHLGSSSPGGARTARPGPAPYWLAPAPVCLGCGGWANLPQRRSPGGARTRLRWSARVRGCSTLAVRGALPLFPTAGSPGRRWRAVPWLILAVTRWRSTTLVSVQKRRLRISRPATSPDTPGVRGVDRPRIVVGGVALLRRASAPPTPPPAPSTALNRPRRPGSRGSSSAG